MSRQPLPGEIVFRDRMMLLWAGLGGMAGYGAGYFLLLDTMGQLAHRFFPFRP